MFEGERLADLWRIQTERRLLPDDLGLKFLALLDKKGLQTSSISGAIISSVVPPLTPAFRTMFETYFDFKPMLVEPGIKTGIVLRYEDPRQLGADRLVNAVAALHYYGGPAIVVDFGTATKFEALSANMEYLGGAISPGINIAAEALFREASRLYRVELVSPPHAIGRNITNSIQSGLVFGYIGLVEGLVRRLSAEITTVTPPPAGQKIQVIATGGLAQTIVRDSPGLINIFDPHLTLKGLNYLYQLNH